MSGTIGMALARFRQPALEPAKSVLIDFETNSGGDAITGDWYIDSAIAAQTGTNYLRSAVISHDQESNAYLDLAKLFPAGTNLSVTIWWRVRSEGDYDKFYMYQSGSVIVNGASGAGAWTEKTVTAVSSDVFRFRYKKDYSVSDNEDAAFIDSIYIQGI